MLLLPRDSLRSGRATASRAHFVTSPRNIHPIMKLTRYLSLLTLVLTANAADCTAPNQQWFSDAAVQMMWSIRAWLCPNAWSQSITAGPDGGWCDAGGGVISAYWGSWTISGVQSEQQCWVCDSALGRGYWYRWVWAYNGGNRILLSKSSTSACGMIMHLRATTAEVGPMATSMLVVGSGLIQAKVAHMQ